MISKLLTVLLLLSSQKAFGFSKPVAGRAGKAMLSAQSAKQKMLPCDDSQTQKVKVALGRLTILSFPVTPKDILPGESSFDFRQIKMISQSRHLSPTQKPTSSSTWRSEDAHLTSSPCQRAATT